MTDQRGEINYFHIPVDQNSYSLLTIGTKEFPIHLSFDNLTDYENCFVNWHKQKEVEISLIKKGALHVCLPGYHDIFNEGDIFVIFPDVLHSIKKVEHKTCEYRTLLFDPVFLYGYEGSFWDQAFYRPLKDSDASVVGFKKNASPVLPHELRQIFDRETEFLHPTEQMRLSHHLQEIWVKLFADNIDAKPLSYSNDERLTAMLHQLHLHYAEKFSLDELSDTVGLSRSECCRQFKSKMDMTLMEYLNEYRIGKAMELLEHSPLSMTEIANETGFSGASNFSERFKKKTGMTPGEYRKTGPHH